MNSKRRERNIIWGKGGRGRGRREEWCRIRYTKRDTCEINLVIIGVRETSTSVESTRFIIYEVVFVIHKLYIVRV